jgi:hypothetical protein
MRKLAACGLGCDIGTDEDVGDVGDISYIGEKWSVRK